MVLGEISAPVVETPAPRWGNLSRQGDICRIVGTHQRGRGERHVDGDYRPPDVRPQATSLYSEVDEAFAARRHEAPEGEVST